MAKTKIDFKNMDLGFDEIDPMKKEHELVFRKVNIKLLDENPENNKIYEYDKDADEFLREDIMRNGILNPIVVIKSELHAGRYTIISGHRRTRIAKELGIFEIEAREIIARTPEEKAFAKVMLITANSTQRDRKPSEKAREVQYLKSLMQDDNNIENLAKWISNATKMSERSVYRYDKLAAQPKDIQDAVDSGELTVTQAIGEKPIKRKVKSENKAEKEIDYYKKACELNKITDLIVSYIDNNGVGSIDEETMQSLRNSLMRLKRVVNEYE